MSLRSSAKKFPVVKKAYFSWLLVRNYIKSSFANLALNRREADLLSALRKEVKNFYRTDLNLTNPGQFFSGKNIIGYPALSSVLKDGQAIGWGKNSIKAGPESLPLLQVETDEETNFPELFEKFKPKFIVDFGTASGGTAVYFHQLAGKYTTPRILSVDITDKDFAAADKFHQAYKTKEKVSFLFNKSSLDCFEEVKQFLSARQPGEKTLLSFDDHHSYEHTYQELKIYSPLLQSGDVIVMQDTWDQGLYGHETSPMLAVFRFLKEDQNFALDQDYLKSAVLPCNFIHGVIVKK